MTQEPSQGGWREVRKVVFFDPAYPDSLVTEPGRVAAELQRREGYMILDAAGLRLWMSSQAGPAAAGSICVLAQGVAPDTVVETRSPECTLRRYLEAGGSVLWIGDTPFTSQGNREGTAKYWGDAGHRAVLGFDPVLGASGEVEITRAGREWGLSYEAENTCDCAYCRDVSTVLSEAGVGLASSYVKNFNRRFPLSGFIKYRAAPFTGDWDRMLEDLVRLGRHALGEDKAAEPVPAPPAPEPEPEPAEQETFGDAPQGELVETGVFRVDRARALEKLSLYQFPDAGMYLLPWVRAAVASDAAELEVRRSGQGLELRFDGDPFTRADLEDPYCHVLDVSRPRGAPCRNLALGILSALRLQPRSVTVASGRGDARVVLRLGSFMDQTAEVSADQETRTVVTVRWEGLSTPSLKPHLAYLETHCAACPIPIRVEGAEVERAWLKPVTSGLGFREGGARGWVGVPADPLEASLLETHVLGVLVGTTQFALPRVQVTGYVADNLLRLNASQTGVVHDERFAALEEILGAQSDKLVVDTVEQHLERMNDTGGLVLGGYGRQLWSERIEKGSALDEARVSLGTHIAEALLPGARDERVLRGEVAAEVRWDVRVCVWLRDACRRLLSDLRQYEIDANTPALKALWDAPVYFGVRGEPLSWHQVEGLRHSLRHIPFSGVPCGHASPTAVVWKVCPGDLKDLEIRYGDVLRDVTWLLATGAERSEPD